MAQIVHSCWRYDNIAPTQGDSIEFWGTMTQPSGDSHASLEEKCSGDQTPTWELLVQSPISAIMKLRLLFPLMAGGLLAACSTVGPVGNASVPQPAKAVELNRYLGHWFELARYENRFETDCEEVTADYSRRNDGMIRVVNTCRKGSADGTKKSVEGRAKIVTGSGNAKLKVSFFGPFFGDYWVLDHATDYSWSIVGEPSGRYLWILTRTAKPSDQTRKMLVNKARSFGYDVGLLRWTQH